MYTAGGTAIERLEVPLLGAIVQGPLQGWNWPLEATVSQLSHLKPLFLKHVLTPYCPRRNYY